MVLDRDKKVISQIKQFLSKAGASMEDDGYLLIFNSKDGSWEVGDFTGGCERLQAGAIACQNKSAAEQLCQGLSRSGIHLGSVARAFSEMVADERKNERKKEDPYKREVAITSKEDGCILAHLRVDFNEKTFEADFDEDVVDVAYAERFKFKPVAVDE